MIPSGLDRTPQSSALGGVLNLCKPAGITSFDAVSAARRMLKEKKVGHCGTLDPMAEGVLLIVYGSATRRVQELMQGEKVYRARMRLGIRTDTGDKTGKILESREVPPISDGQILAAFQKLSGKRDQVPPMYSALKWGGRKLYELAREGKVVPRPARSIEIFSMELIGRPDGEIEFRTRCSKGTYIRTLAEEVGAELGLFSTLSALVRERSGSFSIADSLSWDRFRTMSREELLKASLPADDFLEAP